MFDKLLFTSWLIDILLSIVNPRVGTSRLDSLSFLPLNNRFLAEHIRPVICFSCVTRKSLKHGFQFVRFVHTATRNVWKERSETQQQKARSRLLLAISFPSSSFCSLFVYSPFNRVACTQRGRPQKRWFEIAVK